MAVHSIWQMMTVSFRTPANSWAIMFCQDGRGCGVPLSSHALSHVSGVCSGPVRCTFLIAVDLDGLSTPVPSRSISKLLCGKHLHGRLIRKKEYEYRSFGLMQQPFPRFTESKEYRKMKTQFLVAPFSTTVQVERRILEFENFSVHDTISGTNTATDSWWILDNSSSPLVGVAVAESSYHRPVRAISELFCLCASLTVVELDRIKISAVFCIWLNIRSEVEHSYKILILAIRDSVFPSSAQ